MSTLKKVLALTLALAMILSVSAFAGFYKADTYKDAASIDKDCEDAVELLYALDIMQGDAQGNFRPNDTITRAEVAKMIYVIKNYGKDDKAVTYQDAKIFSDVSATAWYAGYVNYCGVTKLIQGRGNGTFGPNDPVTTAAAAKMLLTAVGYDAEARGYTGANWDKNVLSDAAIVGLLDDYNYTTIGNAPRQWVAVMFANALTNAYTYKTMVAIPGNGLLNESAAIKGNEIVTLGEKYYNLATFTGYLFATEDVYIDKISGNTFTADEDMAIFAKKTGAENTANKTEYIEVDNPGLGYMDLGQQYRVIYNKKTDAVYSAKATGKSTVADSELKDIEVDNTQATSSNKANNKYIFTIGEMEAKFDDADIKALNVVNGGRQGVENAKTYNVKTLANAAGDLKTDLYRAIDKDGDGDIDYMIIVNYTYAQVTKVAEHKSYGEYFNAKNVAGETYGPVGFNGNNWYLSDVVNTDAELEVGNVLKINYNVDNGKYDVEVLPVAEGVTYEKRTTKGVHTLGGEEYQVAENGWKNENNNILVSGNLKDDMNLVADGSLVVLVKPVDSNYDNLDDINAQLVMVTGAYVDVYSNPSYNRYFINYMTIDGEMHEEVRLLTSKSGVKVVTYEELTGKDYTNTAVDGSPAYLDNHQHLFVLRESGNEVYLIKLTEKNAQDTLDYADSLLDGYVEYGYNQDKHTLDTARNSYGSDFVNNENKFFYSYTNSKGVEKFSVVTMDDLGEGVAEAAKIQGLYTEKRGVKTYQAGYIYADLEMNKATGYLYTTSGRVSSTSDDAYYLDDVVFADGEAPEAIEIASVDGVDVSDSTTVKANCLYGYTYDKVNGTQVYSLYLIDETSSVDHNTKDDVVKYMSRFDFDILSANNKVTGVRDNVLKYELKDLRVVSGKNVVTAAFAGVDDEILTLASDCEIVLKKVVLDRDQTQNKDTDELSFSVDSEISFTDFETLMADDTLYNGESDDTYTYYSDFAYAGNSNGVTMLYVVTYAVEKAAQ